MAQDFYDIYGIGVDSLTISTLDLSGIALASIKELYKQKKELEQKVLLQEKIQLEQDIKIKELEKLIRNLLLKD